MRIAGLILTGMMLAGSAQAATLLRTVSSTGVSSTAVSVTGNVSAAKFIGDGSALTGVTAIAGAGGSALQMQYNNNGALGGSGVYFVSSTGNVGFGTSAPGAGIDLRVGYGIVSNSGAGWFTRDRTTGINLSGIYRAGGVTHLYDDQAGGVIQFNTVGNVGVGQAPGGYKLSVNGSIIAGSWIRTTGSTGWYNETYSGGWYMADGTWIRSYGGKPVYSDNIIRADGGFNVGGNQGIGTGVGLSCGDSIYFTGGIIYAYNAGAGCNGDVAEHYGTEETVHRGDIVMLGSTTTSRDFRVSVPSPGETSKTTYTITTANVRKATTEGRGRILGVVPTAPFTFSTDKIDPKDNPQQVALVGHVPVKMTLEGGPVKIGDPITVAENAPGKGRKATTSGRILGYALENYTKDGDSKDGMIEVFVHLEAWDAPEDKQDMRDAIAELRAEVAAQKVAIEALRKARP